MARKNLYEKMEDLKDNIEIYGLGSGLANTVLDAMIEGLDEMEERFDRKCDKLLEVVEDPKKLLVPKVVDFSFDKPCSKKKLEPGDIIAATRKLPYQHYAVYIGDGRVIHFAAKDGDWGGTPVIHEAPFENFLRDSDGFEILEFSETRKTPKRYNGVATALGVNMLYVAIPTSQVIEQVRDAKYHLYSPEETVERAKQVAEQCATERTRIETIINGHKYHLVFNNCEHFAIWCKTGVHESRQVDKILRLFSCPVSQTPAEIM